MKAAKCFVAASGGMGIVNIGNIDSPVAMVALTVAVFMHLQDRARGARDEHEHRREWRELLEGDFSNFFGPGPRH